MEFFGFLGCDLAISLPCNFCRYLHFDFHKICGHVHFERLSILYEQIEDFLIKSRCNYFLEELIGFLLESA